VKSDKKSISYILTWQFLGKFLLQGVNFLTIPIFTRLLTTSDYGKVAVYTAWCSLYSLIVGLQVSGSIANAKIKFGDDKIDGYLSSIMTISIISFILVLFISLIFNQSLSSLFDLRPDLIITLAIQSFGTFCVSFHVTKLIQYKKVEQNVLLSFFILLFTTILSILFIYINENRYIAKIYGNAIPIIAIAIVIIFYIYKKGKKIYDKVYWGFCLTLTLPLIFHHAGHAILSQSDKVMLQKMSGDSISGIYSFAGSIGVIIQGIWMVFNSTWIPFYYEYKKDKKIDMILSRSKNYIIVFSLIVIIFILMIPEICKLISPREYWQGIPLIPIIVSSYYLNFLYGFSVNFEFFYAKTTLIAAGTISSAIINIILNFLFIPLYGSIGVAIATLISHIFLFAFHEFIARIVIKNFEYKFSMYLVGLIPVCFAVVLYYFIQDYWIIQWAIGIAFGCYLLSRIIRNKSIF
jgi:O-antigen/teichoic acid export membrane protein